jgi:hypothetical protein
MNMNEISRTGINTALDKKWCHSGRLFVILAKQTSETNGESASTQSGILGEKDGV